MKFETNRLPSLFIGHGTPTSALLSDDYTRALGELGAALLSNRTAIRAVVVLAANSSSGGGSVGVCASPKPLVHHDFVGFQPELYQMDYPCVGSPALAAEIAQGMASAGIEASLDQTRWLGSGAWIPLKLLFPQAQVPVIQIAMPTRAEPRMVLKMGHALAAFRRQGILILGTGSIVSNPERVSWPEKHGEPFAWAREFSEWVRPRIETAQIEELVNFRDEAPSAELAQPKGDAILPLFFTLGAALKEDRAHLIFDGYQYRSLSLYSFMLN